MMRSALVAWGAAVVCAACGSDGGNQPSGTGGKSMTEEDAGSDGGAGGTKPASGGRAGSGGKSGGAGAGGSGGSLSSGGSPHRDASADGGEPPVDGGDAGSPDSGARGVEEWPFKLPAQGVCTVQGWCWEAPKPLGNSLESVWGSGPNDVWFSGHAGTGTLAHWDGTKVHGLTGLVSEWGNLVTGGGPKDVWVLGGPHALHFDGKAWARHEPGTDKALRAAHVVNATLAYAVGAEGTVVKWDGTNWAPFASSTTDDLSAVWAFSDKDVWIAGTNAYHWNGTSWSSAPACIAFWGDTPNDLFCVRAGVALARYDGAKWTDIGPIAQGPVRALWGTGPKDVVVLANGGTYRYNGTTFALAATQGGIVYDSNYPREVGLWGSTANDYWAAGPRVATAPGSLFRFQGTAWAPVGENLVPDGISCAHQGTAFVGSGIAWTAHSDSSGTSKLARWDGTTYTEYSPGTDKPLLALDALSSTDVWVTAEGGDVTHWTGTDEWTASNVGATVSLSALYAAAPGSIWAGGEAGRIFEFDGERWDDRSVEMDSLEQLTGTSPSDVWAVGDQTYHYTDAWKKVELPKEWPRLVAVWGDDPSNLRGVALSAGSPDTCSKTCESTCEAAILGWDGGEWSLLSSPAPACGTTTRPVFRSFYSSGITAWATDGKYAYHYDGKTFSKQVLPSDLNDSACSVAGNDLQVLVAGPYPILRRKDL